jgi:hypothetical protein
VRCECVTAFIAVSWDVTLCGSVHIYQAFGGTSCLLLQGRTKLVSTYQTTRSLVLHFKRYDIIGKNNILTFRVSDEIFCTDRSYNLSFPRLAAFNCVTWGTGMEKSWIRILSNHVTSLDATLRLGSFVTRFLDSLDHLELRNRTCFRNWSVSVLSRGVVLKIRIPGRSGKGFHVERRKRKTCFR